MRRSLYFIIIVSVLSCKDKADKLPGVSTKSTLTVHLAFESSNYDSDTNFVLYDNLGKKCIPDLDTITKGGGTIVYESLPNGIYKYSIRTIFNERVINQIKIDSTIQLNFYDDCYNVKDVIEFDSLLTAKKINLIIQNKNESDLVEIEKKKTNYEVKNNFTDSKGWGNSFFIDSAKLFNALVEFETTIVGLSKMNIHEKNYSYVSETSVYLKVDNQYLEIVDIKSSYLKTAYSKLKERPAPNNFGNK